MWNGTEKVHPAVAIIPVFIGCSQDTSMPTEATVQLAVIERAADGMPRILPVSEAAREVDDSS